MGFFGPYVYKNKAKGEKYFLHVKERGKIRLYYFSKDSAGSLPGVPKGFEVIENPNTGLPFLKRAGGKKEKKPAEKK